MTSSTRRTERSWPTVRGATMNGKITVPPRSGRTGRASGMAAVDVDASGALGSATIIASARIGLGQRQPEQPAVVAGVAQPRDDAGGATHLEAKRPLVDLRCVVDAATAGAGQLPVAAHDQGVLVEHRLEVARIDAGDLDRDHDGFRRLGDVGPRPPAP